MDMGSSLHTPKPNHNFNPIPHGLNLNPTTHPTLRSNLCNTPRAQLFVSDKNLPSFWVLCEGLFVDPFRFIAYFLGFKFNFVQFILIFWFLEFLFLNHELPPTKPSPLLCTMPPKLDSQNHYKKSSLDFMAPIIQPKLPSAPTVHFKVDRIKMARNILGHEILRWLKATQIISIWLTIFFYRKLGDRLDKTNTTQFEIPSNMIIIIECNGEKIIGTFVDRKKKLIC